VLSCGLTHTAVVPLDLVKCRIQVDPAKYKNIVTGFKVSIAEGGIRGLGSGWAPTLIGYSMQGLCKFGFYEVFKNLYSGMFGEVSIEKAYIPSHIEKAYIHCHIEKAYIHSHIEEAYLPCHIEKAYIPSHIEKAYILCTGICCSK